MRLISLAALFIAACSTPREHQVKITTLQMLCSATCHRDMNKCLDFIPLKARENIGTKCRDELSGCMEGCK